MAFFHKFKGTGAVRILLFFSIGVEPPWSISFSSILFCLRLSSRFLYFFFSFSGCLHSLVELWNFGSAKKAEEVSY